MAFEMLTSHFTASFCAMRCKEVEAEVVEAVDFRKATKVPPVQLLRDPQIPSTLGQQKTHYGIRGCSGSKGGGKGGAGEGSRTPAS